MASETQGLASMSHGLRRACRACGPAVLHPPSPPGDSSAGTARRASRGCRQVFGLMDAASANRCLLGRGFPGSPSQCQLRPRLHLPLRGSAGMGATSLDARRTGFPFHPAACGCRNRRPQHIGHGRIRQPIRAASPASPCGRLFALRNRPWRSQPCIPVLRKNTRPPHKRKAGRSPLSGVTPMAPAITRPCLRPRPRPSSTGGCGPACRLPAP